MTAVWFRSPPGLDVLAGQFGLADAEAKAEDFWARVIGPWTTVGSTSPALTPGYCP